MDDVLRVRHRPARGPDASTMRWAHARHLTASASLQRRPALTDAQIACRHVKLRFRNGGYYIVCDECEAHWVAGELSPDSQGNQALNGEERVAVDVVGLDGVLRAAGSGRVLGDDE
jgi:hypothetical protein